MLCPFVKHSGSLENLTITPNFFSYWIGKRFLNASQLQISGILMQLFGWKSRRKRGEITNREFSGRKGQKVVCARRFPGEMTIREAGGRILGKLECWQICFTMVWAKKHRYNNKIIYQTQTDSLFALNTVYAYYLFPVKFSDSISFPQLKSYSHRPAVL